VWLNPTHSQTQLFPNVFGLPNFHALAHLDEVCEDFGGCEGASCNLAEALHKYLQRHVRVADKRNLERSMTMYERVCDSFRYAATGSASVVHVLCRLWMPINHR